MIIEQRIHIDDDDNSSISYVSSDKTMYELFLGMAEEDKEIILSDYELDRKNKQVKLSFQFAKVKSIEGKVHSNNEQEI